MKSKNTIPLKKRAHQNSFTKTHPLNDILSVGMPFLEVGLEL
jgi:hypothetical protein